jgi:predicted ATPase
LIDRCRRTGDSRQIEQLADRMLALDDLSEEAIRAKMEARAFAGDRLTALKLFEEWKAKLAEAVGAVPTDSLENIAASLRGRGWTRAHLAAVPKPTPERTIARPFVGRSDEYRALYEAWEKAAKVGSSHALVIGDSGVGKSTLVERLTMAASLEGAAISRVQCYDLERAIPYAALGGLIRGLLDCPGVSATPPDDLAELAKLLPEVRHRFPSIPFATDTQGETARIRLTEAFHEMVKAIADEHPVILVLDNVHIADEASLFVIHLVLRLLRQHPVMTVLVSRPTELAQSTQAAHLRENADELGVCEIDLAPLAPHESDLLLSALIPPDQIQPSAAVRRTLIQVSGGFPMVLELLVQDWQANGEQCFALAMDAMTSELGSVGDPKVAYRRLLTRIMNDLEPTTQSALSLAALLGPRLNDLVM